MTTKPNNTSHGFFRPLTAALVFVLVGGTLAGATWLTANASGDENDSAEERLSRVLPVRVQPIVTQSALPYTRTAIGRVEARRRSSLGFESAGLVEEVMVEEGQLVRKGEVIAKLDTDLLETQLRQLSAALRESEAQLELQEISYKRRKELNEKKVIAVQSYDEARFGLLQIKAVNERIAAERERVQLSIEKASLRAPYDGVISHRHVDEGDVIAMGDPALELMESGRWEIRLAVSARLAANLLPNKSYVLHSVDQGEEIRAQLARLNPMLDDRTRTVDVIFTTESTSPRIREGKLYTLALPVSLSGEAFALPRTSLLEGRRGTWTVYTAVGLEQEIRAIDGAVATHRIQPRPVQVIGSQGGVVYVQGMIDEGEQVIVDGVHKLAANQLVRIFSGEGVQ